MAASPPTRSLELIRRLRERGVGLDVVMTKAAKQFVTPLSVASLSGSKVFDDLFSLTDETEIGHIQLSRAADLVVVAPATADLLARMAHGLADDLAATLLLATDKKILVAPAMNVRMWLHPATRRNVETLRRDGVLFVGPDEGEMACGEYGPGRMSEPAAILGAIATAFKARRRSRCRRASARAGREAARRPPCRRHLRADARADRSGALYRNRSSGKQGHAIAAAAAAAGADVTLVSGPVAWPIRRALRRCMSKPRRKCGGGRGGTAGRYFHRDGGGRRLACRSRGATEDQEIRRPARISRWPKIPTFLPPSRSADPAGRASSSVLLRKPKMFWPMRATSCRANNAI